ncbi:MAG: DUF309 domain-containing protein [Deltaproteobacteria bacterium]|nr:DUF309 domain-containing protein [Deltaproteobacteria bacterium]
MKKRTKEEVEIRNALTEVLILSFQFSEKSRLLYAVSRYCQFVDIRGRDGVRLGDLLGEGKTNKDSSKLDWSDVSDGLSLNGVFEIDLEGYIRLRDRFQAYLYDICAKAGRYWSFISGLYSNGEVFKEGIEGEIKKGILLFNEGFYFECHEFLEGEWKKIKGREKSFLKGLIHAGVAFYHLEYENYKGTINYLKRSHRRLKGFEPVFLGVDVKTFLIQIDDYSRSLEENVFMGSESLKNEIPKIRLVE